MSSHQYKNLNSQIFTSNNYSIVPIRLEDRMDIMKWRNEQIYHLRQAAPLTKIDQDNYFKNVVEKLFTVENPDQILFSYLEGERCIGYGGLVHINYIDKNAEISFIMDTELEEYSFKKHWIQFLTLIEEVAFEQLNLHKIFTYAFDLRPLLYEALETCNFMREAVLKEHCYFEKKYKDVLIHSKFNAVLKIREFNFSDKEDTFKWANDALTRENSFSSKPISFESHSNWFDNKIKDNCADYYIGEVENVKIGLVRFDYDFDDKAYVIGITIDQKFRGKKLATKFLQKTCKAFLKEKQRTIFAYIKKSNISSKKAFERAGFKQIHSYTANNNLKYQFEFNKM